MVRVGISVEGLTEERFMEIVLQPHFLKKNIFVVPISLGGNINVDRVGRELTKLLYSFDVVSTFYDFYGFQKKEADETKESLETRILRTLPADRQQKCIPYIQMYEFEGLLFSSPSALASVLNDKECCTWAEKILQEFGNNPESINDSPQTAPSKRLVETPYRKVTHGPMIAQEIGLPILRERCTGFGVWLNSLEAL